MKTFPFSTYIVITANRLSMISRIHIIRYELSNGILMEEVLDPNDHFERDLSQFNNVVIEQIERHYEIYVTDSLKQLLVFKLGNTDVADCFSGCTQCKSFDGREESCISCEANEIEVGGSCVCNTSGQDFVDQEGSCIPCSGKCKTCEVSADKCLSCKDGYHYQSSTRTCTCETFSTVYGEAPNETCECLVGYSQLSGPQSECEACSQGCKSCNLTPSSCTSCFSGFEPNGETCDCPAGKTIVGNECQSCGPNCSSCQNGYPLVCTTCTSNYKIINNDQCGCLEGTFDDGLQCKGCDSLCRSCSETAEKCLSCFDNFEHSDTLFTCFCIPRTTLVGQICQNCGPNCSSCESGTPLICSSCDSNYEITENNECGCLDGTFDSGTNCWECDPICKTCSQNSSSCSSCDASKGLALNNQNPPSCICSDSSHYITISNTCIPLNCESPCSSCDYSSSNCTACSNGYILTIDQQSTGTCLCPSTTHTIDSYGSCILKPQEPQPPQVEERPDPSGNEETTPTIPSDQINLEYRDFLTSLKEIIIQFDTPISVSNFSSFSVEISDTSSTLIPQNRSLKIYRNEVTNNNKSISFQIDLESNNIENDKLYLHCDPSRYPTSIQNPEINFSDFPVVISPINYFQIASDYAISKATQAVFTTVKVTAAISILTSTQNYIALAKLLQIIDFLHLMNIVIPNNVDTFYNKIKGDFIEFIPNPFYKNIALKCDLHKKVENAGFECLVANNNGQFILVLIFFLGLKIVVFSINFLVLFIKKSLFSKTEPVSKIKKKLKVSLNMLRLRRVLSTLKKFIFRLLSWTSLVNILISLQIDVFISVSIYLQVKYYYDGWFIRDQEGNVEDYLSISLSIFYIVTYTVITIGMVAAQIQFFKFQSTSKSLKTAIKSSSSRFIRTNRGQTNKSLKSKILEKKIKAGGRLNKSKKGVTIRMNVSTINKNIREGIFLSFYDEIRLPNRVGSLYIMISYLRDILVPSFIISFTWRPQVQFYCVFGYMLLKLIFLVSFRPFKTLWKNMMELMTDTIFVVILVLYIVLLELGDMISPKSKYFYIGYPIIGLVVSLVLINLINQLKQSLATLALIFRGKKRVKTKSVAAVITPSNKGKGKKNNRKMKGIMDRSRNGQNGKFNKVVKNQKMRNNGFKRFSKKVNRWNQSTPFLVRKKNQNQVSNLEMLGK